MATPKAKRAPAKKVEKPTVASNGSFTLTIIMNGRTESVSTHDLATAVAEMTGFDKFTTKALIRIERDGRSVERWLYPFRARRLFSNRLFAQIFFKQLLLVL